MNALELITNHKHEPFGCQSLLINVLSTFLSKSVEENPLNRSVSQALILIEFL